MKLTNSIAAAMVLLFVTHAAHALDPSQPFSSYISTRFTTDNGLSTNIINEVIQSRDGFLWMILGNGVLARFDGQRFTNLPIDRVRAMAIGPNGDLWVGSGPTLKQIPVAALAQYGPLQAISYSLDISLDGFIICLHFSRSGVLWIGTTQGLYRLEHGIISSVLPQPNILRIEESSNGDLLLSTSQGFMAWNGSRVNTHPELAAQLGVKPEKIFHMFEDSQGVTWICTAWGVARRVGNSIEKLQPWGAKKQGALRAYEDPQGNVWIAGAEGQGLFRASGAGLELAVKGIQVRSMYGDRDGNLWVGTNTDGLFRFKDRAVRMFTKADGLPGNLPMTVLTSHDGTLWIGFNCGGLVRYDGHKFHTYDEKDGLLNNCVFSLAEDPSHDLLIGTWGGGAFRFHNGIFTQYSKAQGLPSDVVLSIFPARDGSLWFGTHGLSHWRNGQIRNYTTADGLSTNQVQRVYEDRNGGIWIGTQKGINHLEGDHFVTVSSIPDDFAAPLGEGPSGALYVSVHSRGVFRVDNNQITEIIPAMSALELRESKQGDFWLNADGIMRAPRVTFEKPRGRDEPPDFELYGVDDGMATSQTSFGYPSSTFTLDGKLWVATTKGLAMLDVPRLSITDRKPTIYMQEFTVGRNQQLPGQELVLAPGTSHVELRFDAVEITSPEKIRMQYRLDGVDSEWLDADPPGHAIYSTIPPGTHAFHIRACNRNGIWDRTGMVYVIVQKPFFYQTTWFRLAVITTALLMVVGLYRLRLHQATARLNALFDERLSERTRIARELHDTLLQTVQGSKLVADHALKKCDEGVAVRGALEKLSRWLGQATQEGRAALNSLRTSTAENDLAAGLRRAVDECQPGRSMAIKFSVAGKIKDLHPIARDEIYRIGHEAIRNACEHASASELEIILTYAQDLTLRVSDDGTGMEAAVVTDGREGHFGLQGMRERAERIGSKLTLKSALNSGTEITLVVPGSVIFRKSTATRFERIKGSFGLHRSSELH